MMRSFRLPLSWIAPLYGPELRLRVLLWVTGAALTGYVFALAEPSAPARGQNAPLASQAARAGMRSNSASPVATAALVPMRDARPVAAGSHLDPWRSSRDLAIARPFRFQGASDDRDRAVDCLGTAAWYEAGDDVAGERSVIQVVLNRLKHPSFPKSVCGVVYQGAERPTGCQFTFACDGSLTRRHPSLSAWLAARRLAQDALNGRVETSVLQATHYHADYVLPWWSDRLERLTKVGAHVFYRWPGSQGALTAKPGVMVETAHPLPVRRQAGATSLSYDLTVRNEEAKLAPAGPGEGPIFLRVDEAGSGGRWALVALTRCAGRKTCSVLAYGDGTRLDRNRALPAPKRERPLFLFRRDAASGMDVALWDCERVPRPDAAQCLPAAGPELQQLMRDATP